MESMINNTNTVIEKDAQKKTQDKTIRFLVISLIITLIVCVITFSAQGYFMNKKSEATIKELGSLYMENMDKQLSMHFETIMELRLSQVLSLNQVVLSAEMDEKTVRKELRKRAEARGFSHVAFYSRSGNFDMLSPGHIQLIDPEPFLTSLNAGDNKVAIGLDESGHKVVLFGASVDYQMRNGEKCTALVMALPVESISDMLSLGEDNSMVYSHIIRKDGSFIVRGQGTERLNYLEQMEEDYGKNNRDTIDRYKKELLEAMENRADYSGVFQIDGQRRQIYCTPLNYSEWYLVTVMPYGTLDKTVSQLSMHQLFMTIGGCVVILGMLLVIFTKYFRLTRKQIEELERARSQAEAATRAKSEFLSNMSHDIRTPMNAIVGMTAIATANFDNPEQVKHCLRKITLSSKHLLGLINDVLDMSKIESGKMTLNKDLVSLREVLESLVSIVQPQVKAKKLNFDVLIDGITVENVCTDSVRLNQVLLNLLSNAIKFTPEGGTINVSFYEERSPKGDEYVRTHVKVKDTGIGMSKDFQKNIFESYVREDNARVNKTEGAGLGMAITKYIVDAMDGSIEINSELGKGSEFHVIIDFEKATVPEEEMILPEWNMLVVDDDEQLCRTTVEALAGIGLKADWALDGESAIEMVHKRHARHDDYQIILLDWKLPGMDGIETAKAIREEMGDDIPILLISAYDWNEIEDQAREAGVTGFIAKPLFRSTLYYGLKEHIEGAQVVQSTKERKDDFHGKRILVAEDNELNWEIASELLSELDLQLEWAENGQLCVDLFEKSEPGYYDMILMDIRMPVMTGYEAAKAIRAMNRSDSNIPIVAMTADAFAEDIRKALESGMNAHTAKPIDMNEITRLLKRYIG
ncbi:response regulator [Ihubacter sp. rT4E-8]|uniref:hybrid sensor histidine kinase/response regulator n=1 Tax=Ihubacter sp. rT4E-8 TaxID=3242369 RepID=UPI003CF562A7